PERAGHPGSTGTARSLRQCDGCRGIRSVHEVPLWRTFAEHFRVRRRTPARAVAAPSSGSAAEGAQPALARFERLLGLRDGPLVARLLGRRELLLELLDRVRQLTRHVVRARLLLRVVALPVGILARTHTLLDLAQLVVQTSLGLAREDAADLVPAALDPREARARLPEVALIRDGASLLEQSPLRGDLLPGCLGIRRLTIAACGVQGVARGLETGPQGVVGLLAGTAGRLPLVEELAVLGDALLALRSERLGPLDQLGLAVADGLVSLVELGVELAAVAVDGGASVAEPLPQRLRGRLGKTRTVLLLELP